MNSEAWLAYFSNNQRPDGDIPSQCGARIEPRLRAELAHSIARFQLGEASGGRIAGEVETAPDRALDGASRRAIQLYVLEEGRHARELYLLVCALGGEPLRQHWSSDWFRRVRRCLGLRTKMLTMAAAEVVGIAYYSALHDRVPCEVVQTTLGLIAQEEKRHLDFQAEWFARAIERAPWFARPFQVVGIALRFGLILSAAVLSVLLDHGRVLAGFGIRRLVYVRACARAVSERSRFFYGRSGYCGSASWISYQSAFDATKMCNSGPVEIGVSSVPRRTRTAPGAVSRRVRIGEPQLEQNRR
jgi:hypothetical protein